MPRRFEFGRRPWQDLYEAALFEGDRNKALERIAEAESAIGVRARVLFNQPHDGIEERRALNAALHTLRFLKDHSAAKTAS
jgi:hypothetical protein